MPQPNSKLLDAFARRAALEVFTIESEPAIFEPIKGERVDGFAEVSVSQSAIAIRFTSDALGSVAKAGYGQTNGRIRATNGSWLAAGVNDFGPSSAGDRLFGAQELATSQGAGEESAATRLVFAGAAWFGSGSLNGRRVIAAPLSKDFVSHHDARLSIVIDDDIDEKTIETMDRSAAFVAGLDLELKRVDSFSALGGSIRTRHLRGYRRVGRGPHSPFAGVADEFRMRALVALAATIPRLAKDGVPIIEMINLIAAHNHVAEINASAPLLLLSTLTAAYHNTHGNELVNGAASRRREMASLSQDLSLGLRDADLDRFEKLRVELLEAGFFHRPGYETGRPQSDIKFLRDIAHMIVFRLCGYTGPFYGAETFAVRDIASAASQIKA